MPRSTKISRRKPIKRRCWGEWTRDHRLGEALHMKRKVICRRDKRFSWTIAHAACASNSPTEELQQFVRELKQRRWCDLFHTKDKEGDTPMHSTVTSDNLQIVKMLCEELEPVVVNTILATKNKKGETPLNIAFNNHSWPIVKFFLAKCIDREVCRDLTGIVNVDQPSFTLLHEAMKEGKIEFLDVYLQVTKSCGVKPALVTLHQNKTPWHYLMNHRSLDLLKKALNILKGHNIDLNTIVTDNNRSTLLHIAYRKNLEEFCKFLLQSGADPNKKDASGVIPEKRCYVAKPTKVHTTIREERGLPIERGARVEGKLSGKIKEKVLKPTATVKIEGKISGTVKGRVSETTDGEGLSGACFSGKIEVAKVEEVPQDTHPRRRRRIRRRRPSKPAVDEKNTCSSSAESEEAVVCSDDLPIQIGENILLTYRAINVPVQIVMTNGTVCENVNVNPMYMYDCQRQPP